MISQAQFGIILSGLVSIAAGCWCFGAAWIGRKSCASVPAVAMIIGLTLAGNAMTDAPATVSRRWCGLSHGDAAVHHCCSKRLRCPAAAAAAGRADGCVTALLVHVLGGGNFFQTFPADALVASTWKLGDGSLFALPAFSLPKPNWAAVAALMPIAIATIPESTAHMYQLDIYVNDLARRRGKKRYDLAGLLDRNLIGDGLCDMISGVIGGPAGTNYGENISTMAITKVFSVPVMFAAGTIAMVISCFTPLISIIYAILPSLAA